MQTIDDIRRDFDNIYSEAILNIAKPLEERRKKDLAKVIICIVVAVILISLFPFIFKFLDSLTYNLSPNADYIERSDLLIWVFMLLGGVVVFLFVYPCIIAKKFEKSVKKDILPFLFSHLSSFKWSDKRVVSNDFIQNSRLFSDFIKREDDDSFKGQYKNVSIRIFETFLGGVATSYESILKTRFEGVIVALLPKKKYKGVTLIKKKRLINLVPKDLKKVNIEDINFEKQYNVYSNDLIAAKCTLTASFMESFKKIKLVFKASQLEASISKQGILIAISTQKDLFKIGKLYKPVVDYEQFREFTEELLSILELVDTLKLC